MKIIESLTQAQIDKFPEYVEKWTKIGLCTDPANRKEAEQAIIQCYKLANLEPPKKIVWCGSPLSQGLTRAILLDKKIWDSVRASVRDSGYGSHDAYWIGFFDFFRNELNLKNETEKLQGLTELSQHAGWFLPHKNICWVAERHSVLRRDEKGRLHSLTSEAIAYPDGWKIYAVHGVRVPEKIILYPNTITINEIESENNLEIKRVMIDLYGQERFLKNSGALFIQEDKFGKLYKKEISNDEPLVMVKVINSTPEPDGSFKEYFLRVPPETKTAREGVAYTFEKNENDYCPFIET